MSKKLYLTHGKFPIPDKNTWFEMCYTPEEARAEGIEWIKDWKKAEEGQWLLTTDGFVLRCLRRGYIKTVPYIRTAVGTFWSAHPTCDTKYRENRYSISGKRLWSPDVSKKRCSKAEDVFCFWISQTGDRVSAFQKAWPTAHAYQPKWSYEHANNMLCRPHVKREIARLMGKIADSKGITDEWVIEKAEELYGASWEERDLKLCFQIVSFLGNFKQKVMNADVFTRPADLTEDEKKELEEKMQKDLRKEPVGGNDRVEDGEKGDAEE